MTILIVFASIYVFTGIVWLAKKYTPIDVCPICAGVMLTWLILLIGITTGLLPTEKYQLITSILMGGSVVGLAYKLEEKIKADKSLLLWKILFIPIGFALTYSLVLFQLIQSFILLLILGIITISFLKLDGIKVESKSEENKKVEELKDKMKNCC